MVGTQIGLRLDDDLLQSLDIYVEKEKKRLGLGIRFSRTEAIRQLVALGLEREQLYPLKKKRGKK